MNEPSAPSQETAATAIYVYGVVGAEACSAALFEDAARAERLLTRYGPTGAIKKGSATAWAGWFRENRAYLFFSDQAPCGEATPVAVAHALPAGSSSPSSV